MQYISINLYRKVVEHALFEGMPPEELAGLPTPIAAIDDLQAVPADHFFELHERVADRLGPGFAVRVGQQMKMDDYGVLGLSWKTCARAGEIFERCERYFKLLSNTYVFRVIEEGEVSKVHLYRDAHRRGVERSNEATFSATVVVLQAMTESAIAPLHIAFKHSAPPDLSSYHEAFQCPVLFDQDQYYMAYRTADLAMRSAKADSSINAFLLERVAEATAGIEISADKIVADVEGLIQDALPGGIPGIAQIGQHMGMSRRTLTRRLAERNLSFRDLVQQTQESIAKDRLRNSSSSVGEIAFETGFSEQSAFNRAFKRWTGVSPTAFRRE
jgi:AraC-like DNA-binding protein